MNIENIFGFTENTQDMQSQDVMNTQGVMDENQMMQEAALNNPPTTQPPLTVYRGGTQKRPVGGTREAEDKKDGLYNINIGFLNNMMGDIEFNDVDYAKSTLTALNRNITLDGKTYTIDKLGDLMKDKNNVPRVLKLIDDLQDDPELPADVRWKNVENRVTNVMLNGEWSFFNKKLSEEMYSAAKTHDAFYGDKSTQSKKRLYWANQNTRFLFDENGRMRTRKEFNEFVSKERQKELEQVEKEMVIPDVNDPNMSDYQRAQLTTAQFNQRSDMGSWLPKLQFRDIQGRQQSVSTVRNPLGLPEYDLKVLNKKNKIFDVNQSYNALNYDDLVNTTMEFYNKPNSKSTKFKTIAEKKYTKDNKGGELQTQTGDFEFDFTNPKYYDKNEKKQVIKSEIKEFARLVKLVTNDPGQIIYNAGKVTVNPSQSVSEKEDIKQLFQYMSEDMAKKKTGPRGFITFQASVKGADGKMYDAYTFKLNNNYIDQQKFKGEKKEGEDGDKAYNGLGWKNNRIYAKQGFTVYIPSKVSQNYTQTAQRYKQASTTSSVEALLNTTGTVSMELPNAGALTITKDDNTGAVTFSGYGVNYNPDNGKYDTTNITPNQVILGSPDVDIDYIFINDYLRGLFKNLYYMNDQRKQQTLKQKGVKDPNQLTGQ
jgi:hypothetical protein